MSSSEDAIRAAGMRVTRQRVAIVDELGGQDALVTAQDLHHALRSGPDAPGLATVYRTLSALAAAGQIDTFTRDGEQAFRLCGHRHHHHLVCEACGTVTEVTGQAVERWVDSVARRRGFEVTGHTVDVFGVCRDCR